ncbi:hypothetical protein L7F22_066287 [Adiantum nelumboides]|nr:hypothetical protein [Adiantum nelumboides]
MLFLIHSLSISDLVRKVETLLEGHPDLMAGFNTFLPPPADPAQSPPKQIISVQSSTGGFRKALEFIKQLRAQNEGHYHELQSVLIAYRNGKHPSSENIQSQVAGLWKISPDLLQDFASFLPKNPVKFVSTSVQPRSSPQAEKDEQDSSIKHKRRNKKGIDCEEYDVLRFTKSYTQKRQKVQAEITVNELENVKMEMTELEVAAQTHATVLSNPCGPGDEMRLRESAPQSFKCLQRRSVPVFSLWLTTLALFSVLTDKVDILDAVNKNSLKEISKIEAFLETAKRLHSDALISLQNFNMQVVQDTIVLNGDIKAQHVAFETGTKKVMTRKQPRMTKRQRERYAAKRQRSFISMPISELDLSDCMQCTPSYRHLPHDHPLPSVCGRKKRDKKLLNDIVVISVSNNNVNYNVKKRSSNPYVEKLWKVDDDRYELDMVLQRTSSTIKSLKSILKRLSRKPEKEMVVEKHLTVIHFRHLEQLYKNVDIRECLEEKPDLVIPKILARLKAKKKEWLDYQRKMNIIWKECFAENHQAILSMGLSANNVNE